MNMTRVAGKRTADIPCYKIGNMILSMSPKNIFIFSALVGGVLATNNLRELKTRHNRDKKDNKAAATPYHGPSITLDKKSYDEGEDITVSFSVGRPNDPFFSSTDAPSLNLDFNYPRWSIGLFMRDADPQGGSLDPIVGINICDAMENCDPDNLDFEAYTSSVTFGSKFDSLMEGQWPVKQNDYGEGLDAYVLDANGAAAIGPFEFEIHGSEEKPKPKKMSALARYSHAKKPDTNRKHAGISKAAEAAAKLHENNGLVSSGNEAPSHSEDDTSFRNNSVYAEKRDFQEDESISINFNLDDIFKDEDKSNWQVAFFSGSTGPHGGDFDPIVSIPICGEKQCEDMVGKTEGQVTFGRKTIEAINGFWPINFDQWGNDFNVYVIDDSGVTVIGPAKISVLSNEYA